MFDYLRGRPTLQRVVLLLDCRIELKASDHTVMELLDRAAVTYQLVLTKADGVKPGALARKEAEVQALAAKHAAAFPVVVATSSQTGLGIENGAGGVGRARLTCRSRQASLRPRPSGSQSRSHVIAPRS